MFIDEVKIQVVSGKGGDGIIAFRREKHVPLGGPSGGDGGNGGSVVFQADEGLSTLYDLRFRKVIRATSGESGKIKNMRGKDAEDVVIKVPIGTIIYDNDTDMVIADLIENNKSQVICRGGRGGRGNASFASSRNKAPRIQENGEPGETRQLRIELKLLADVGIVGLPSVGKSTLISVVSMAKPKIADYPFTTLIPNLGVVELPQLTPFVLADMPGLIKGASQGAGLGIQFLKHIERTRVIIHMVDMSENSNRDPYADYLEINAELQAYRQDLLQRPQIVAASKMDMPGANQRLAKFSDKLGKDIPVYPISAKTNNGIRELMAATAGLLATTPKFPSTEPLKVESDVLYEFAENKPRIIIEHPDEHTYVVSGAEIERLYKRSNFVSDESVARFLQQMRKLGVDDELRKIGAKSGDTIRILDFELEYFEE